MDITVYRDFTPGQEAVYVVFDDGEAGILMVQDGGVAEPCDSVPTAARLLVAVDNP
jgi:hypothetical protein